MPVNQQQIEYLNAMGIPVWISRSLEIPDDISESAERVGKVAPTTTGAPQAAANETTQRQSVGSHLSSLAADLDAPTVRKPQTAGTNAPAGVSAKPKPGLHAANDLIRDLQQTPSNKIAEIAASLGDEPVAKAPAPLLPAQDLDELGWNDLQQAVIACTSCDLHNQRQQTVFGRGSTQAQWMIVGDIPRLEDEWLQQPFSGESGKLLGAMLESLGLDNNSVYMTNLLKCRPPLDRPPAVNQATSCLSYLQRQIELLKPELVILMGRDTAQQVLGSTEPMARLRQQLHRREGLSAPMIATYHPAYLLKQPRLKAQAWQDLQYAKRAMQ